MRTESIARFLGTGVGQLNSVKLGQGLVGKSAAALIALFIAAGAIGYGFKNDWMRLISILLIASVFVWFFRHIKKFAVEHPDLALMEGATLSVYRQQSIAANGVVEPNNDKLSASNPTALGFNTSSSND